MASVDSTGSEDSGRPLFQSNSLVRKNLKHLTLGSPTIDKSPVVLDNHVLDPIGVNNKDTVVEDSNSDVIAAGLGISHGLQQGTKLNKSAGGGLWHRRGVKKTLTLNPNSHFRGGSNESVGDLRKYKPDKKIIIQQNSTDVNTSPKYITSTSPYPKGANYSTDISHNTILHQPPTLKLPVTENKSSYILSYILSRSQNKRNHTTNTNTNTNNNANTNTNTNANINDLRTPPISPDKMDNLTSPSSPDNGTTNDDTPLSTMSSMPNIMKTPVAKHKKASQYQLHDLVQLGKIGSGNSGTVLKVLHVPTSTIISKKIIHIEKNNDTINKQLLSELQIMKNIKPHENIITFYGAFLKQSVNYDIIILMEYMDCGSLDKILHVFKNFVKRDQLANPMFKPVTTWFNIPFILSKISYAVLSGLYYLYSNYKIIHRDIKPSNVLINSKGSIKICDFGVSRKLINSVADTFVGTSTYMSPERIQGNGYSIKGDVWSLGLMVIELITGEFPLGGHNDTPNGILDLLQQIVNEPSPKLPNDEHFPQSLRDFVNKCCVKDAKERGSITELLNHEFITYFNKNDDSALNEKYDIEYKRWCKKIKYKIRQDRQIRRENNERSKLENIRKNKV